MTISSLYGHIRPFVRPYRKLVVGTLLLTVVGSFAAQVNALILRYTVDHINELLTANKLLKDGLDLLVISNNGLPLRASFSKTRLLFFWMNPQPVWTPLPPNK